jgi:hypothetical protein
MFVCDRCLSSGKAAEITALPISNSASAARTAYGLKNVIFSFVSAFYAWKFSTWVAL